MADVFGVVRAYVLSDTSIAALIGTRFYPIKAPQGATYPLITMQEIVEVRYPHLRGPGGLASPTYQIDTWMKEATGVPGFSRVRSLAEDLRQRLDGFTGVLRDMTESPETAYRVSILLADARDLFETDVSGGYYRRSADYVIWHRPVTD